MDDPFDRDRLCWGEVFMDSGGSFLYLVVSGRRLQVLALETPERLRNVQTLQLDLQRAVISPGGSHVYAITSSSLFVFERDSDSGRLGQVDYHESLRWRAEALAVSADGRYLFVFDGDGHQTNVFGLEDDPSHPRTLGTLEQFWVGQWRYSTWNDRCGFASARRGIPAVDVFCSNLAFGVQWRAESGSPAVTDFVSPWQPDRFSQQVPEFGRTRFVATSPDGRHAYLDTLEEGLVVFERVGAGADAYLPQRGFSVSSGNVTVGAISSDGCIGAEEVVRSKWQTRTAAHVEWTVVAGTETAGELCAYAPSRPGVYRLVAEIRTDDRTGRYSSNLIEKE